MLYVLEVQKLESSTYPVKSTSRKRLNSSFLIPSRRMGFSSRDPSAFSALGSENISRKILDWDSNDCRGTLNKRSSTYRCHRESKIPLDKTRYTRLDGHEGHVELLVFLDAGHLLIQWLFAELCMVIATPPLKYMD